METDKQIIAAIYPRVSSDDQKKEGRSFEAQVNKLTKFCEDTDREIYKVYDQDAGRSATLKEDSIFIKKEGSTIVSVFELKKRPGFLQMLEDAEMGLFNEIVIFKWDRFSRNAILQEIALLLFQNMGVTITPTDDSITPLIRKITGNLSEEEINKLKQRINLSLEDKFNAGIIPSKMPYGFIWDKVNKKVLVDDDKASIIKKAFEMTLNNFKWDKICSELNLAKKMYYLILKNKTYYGLISYKGKTKKGMHEPIISKKLFDDVTNLMESRKR